MERLNVGVLSPYLTGEYFGTIIAAVARVASAGGKRVLAFQTGKPGMEFHEGENRTLTCVGWDRLAGVVAIADAAPLSYLRALRARGTPVVGIAISQGACDFANISVDNRGGVSQALGHLVAHGHTRIGFVGCLEHFEVQERYAAYLEGLRAHGLDPDPALVFETPDNAEYGGAEAGKRLIARGLPSTALIAATDLNAVGVMTVLKGHGAQLPDDQAVIGFDDHPAAALVSPPLSTFRQDFAELGTAAAELLLGQLSGKNIEAGRHLVRGCLIVRQSCGCGTAPNDPHEKERAGQEIVRLADLVSERSGGYYDLRRAVRDDYLIMRDLLTAAEQRDPSSLAWMSKTKASAAVFGVWDDSAGHAWPSEPSAELTGLSCEGSLHVVGGFSAHGLPLNLPSEPCPVRSFPPEVLFASMTKGNVVSVVPIVSATSDWGMLAMAAPVDSSFIGQDTYFMWAALFAEVLDHQALVRSLRDSEERYALAAQAANDALWDWDLRTGRVYYSSRWREMFSTDDTKLGDSPSQWLDNVHPEDRAALLEDLGRMKDGSQVSILNEHRVRGREGGYLWVQCRALVVRAEEEGASAVRLVGSLTDVSERHTLMEQLRHQALYDGLTALPNRTLFMDRLSLAISAARRDESQGFAVLWLDLDNFKVLNDTLGHQAGDRLLAEVGERIRGIIRAIDTAARIGGDEFAILLAGLIDFSSVTGVVRRLQADLSRPYDLEGTRVVVTGSIGMTTSEISNREAEDVLRDADVAMYRAKAKGRGSYVTFDSSMSHDQELVRARRALAGAARSPGRRRGKAPASGTAR